MGVGFLGYLENILPRRHVKILFESSGKYPTRIISENIVLIFLEDLVYKMWGIKWLEN
jgi:hypothetical protein